MVSKFNPKTAAVQAASRGPPADRPSKHHAACVLVSVCTYGRARGRVQQAVHERLPGLDLEHACCKRCAREVWWGTWQPCGRRVAHGHLPAASLASTCDTCLWEFMPAPHTTCKRAHYGRGRVRPRRRAPAGAGWATARTAASWCWRQPPTRTHCPPR